MPYRMHPKQFESVLAMNSADRCNHFISRVADWEQLWGVKNENDWLFRQTDELIYFPVWPHPEYAQKIANQNYDGYSAVEIQLDDFLNNWLPSFENKIIKVGVFPNKEWTMWIMEPMDIFDSLKDELSQYE